MLMRPEDAVKAGRPIYATIDSVDVTTGDMDAARELRVAGAETIIHADRRLGAVSALAAIAGLVERTRSCRRRSYKH